MKCSGNNLAISTFLVRALSLSAVAALTLNPALTPVRASEDVAPVVAAAPVVPVAPVAAAAPVATGGQTKVRFLALGIGKSVIIDLPREVKDVLVADPKIANAVVRSAQRAYIIGAAVGQTNVVFFDAAGQQVAAYDIAVKRDLNGIRAALRQTLPYAGIQIEGVGEGVMLTGSVSSPVEAQQAGDLAARLVGGADKVVNSIAVRGRDQVMLKVTVAEVRRDIVKQMGVDLSASMNYGTAVVNFNNSNPFTANNAPLVPGNNLTAAALNKAGLPTVTATLRAMESAGVVRTLAEPNLTAISGESATFISGGEFPIPTGVTCQTTTAGAIGQCVQTVSFKKFGISLNFTPVVLTEGRISLRVMTEVSEVSAENSLTGGAGGTTIPSIKTRRAETTLEVPSGGSIAMAGLIQEQTKQAVNGLPGLDSLPVLGALFRSQDFVNNQTELMVIVTPYIVRAVAQKELSRPDDGFAPASDSQSTLLAQINRIYGIAGRVETVGSYPGNFGFIID
ncbi:MAG TPA: type II and III secretion system protein family protein [Bradyrhizobium sp.]